MTTTTGAGAAGEKLYRTIMNRASIRKYKDQEVPRDLIERLARAGQQAPFTGQMYSLIVTTDARRREEAARILGAPVLRAPVFMLVCVDFRKLEKFISYRGRANRADDPGLIFLGLQDAAYAAQNIVLAAEEAGLGSCFLGAAPFVADELVALFKLPARVFPLVGLIIGYPNERPPARPRIPVSHCLFWDEYHDLTPDEVAEAMNVMDAGLIREGYYARLGAKIPLPEGADTVGYDEYGWSEHVSRKYGVHGRGMTSGLPAKLERQGIRLR
jgi:nitroreductase